MKIEANTIQDFFANSGDKSAILRELDDFIVRSTNGLDRKLYKGMSINMLGYGYIRYKFANGNIGEWPVISIAAQKNYVSLYICAISDNQYIPEKYKDLIGNVSVGKSCIRFKKFDDLDKNKLGDVLKESEKWYQSQPKPV
ncbi:DUF1801 domain-containing protein [Candidatus Saccharibacteria bacterium]|nr:DUF1801 domain-containing protein [Candidatus Saccharibacteria bacterium]